MKNLITTKGIEKIKLDLKDRKILSIIGNDSRISLSKISKKVALSRDAVKYRISNYEKNGLIQGYRTLIDISKFGYDNYHLFFRLNNPSKEIEKKIIDKLVENDYIRAVIKYSGYYDFEIALVAKSIIELDSVITGIIKDCSPYLQEYEIITISKVFVGKSLPDSFIDFEEDRVDVKGDSKIDKLDIEILKLIGSDSRMTLVDVAHKLKISADAVNYRIKNMKNSGVIIKFIPIINYAAIDYDLHAILMTIDNLDSKRENLLNDFLKIDKNMIWAVKTIGRYNLLVYVLAKSSNDLHDSMTRLRAMFPGSINGSLSLLAYEEYKYLHFPSGLF